MTDIPQVEKPSLLLPFSAVIKQKTRKFSGIYVRRLLAAFG
jgi:hypothetical protein